MLIYINGFILLVDTTPITCPPQPPQQSQMSIRPMAQPKRGRPPKHTHNNNDLMTDGEVQLMIVHMILKAVCSIDKFTLHVPYFLFHIF